jgi:hypothetical protein
MFGFGKRNKVDAAVEMIATAGGVISQCFQDETTLQWKHARRWSAYCGTIPAFTFVVVIQEALKSGSVPPSSVQQSFFKSIEDTLFKLYERDRESHMVLIRECLPLASERRGVCEVFGVDENTRVTMDDVLGLIFQNRFRRYKTDWAEGLLYSGNDGIAEYAAMRLVADLTGIATPQSLAGHTAKELGIMAYGSALAPLTGFASAYARECA